MWILFAVLSAVFAGITSILAKCGIKKTDSSAATAVRTIIVLIFSWIMVFIVGSQNQISQIDFKSWVFLILSGISTGASWLCYFYALKNGNVSKVVPIDKSSVVLTIILSFIFFKEDVTVLKVIAVILTAAGTLMMSINIKKDEEISEKSSGRWLIYAILSAVFASMTTIFGKIGVTDVDSNLASAIRTCIVLVMAWVVVFVKGNTKEVLKISKSEFVFIILSGVSTGASWLCFYSALKDGSPGAVSAIDKMSIVITIAFSRIFFGDHLSRTAGIGLIIIVLGTLALII